MCHTHLIFTRHTENGACNSYELYSIIKTIKPEIIFEELSYTNFDKSYNHGTVRTLETDAVKLYLKDNSTEHVPVDTLPIPESYDGDVEYMLDNIMNNSKIPESFQLRKVMEKLHLLESLHGFSFLNSNYNNHLFKEINALTEEVLRIKNDDRLSSIYRLHKNILQKREDQILGNIYNYSKKNRYGTGLLLLGSGHRETILNKIKRYSNETQSDLEWMFW